MRIKEGDLRGLVHVGEHPSLGGTVIIKPGRDLQFSYSASGCTCTWRSQTNVPLILVICRLCSEDASDEMLFVVKVEGELVAEVRDTNEIDRARLREEVEAAVMTLVEASGEGLRKAEEQEAEQKARLKARLKANLDHL